MFWVERFICTSCFEDSRSEADDLTFHFDELAAAATSLVQVLEDGGDACGQSSFGALAVRSMKTSASGGEAAVVDGGRANQAGEVEDQAAEVEGQVFQAGEVEDQAEPLAVQEEPLRVGCRVRALVPIHYQAESVHVGTLGTLLETSPTVAVCWDGLVMPRSVVRWSQVELLQEERGARSSEEFPAEQEELAALEAAPEEQEEDNTLQLGPKASDDDSDEGALDLRVTVSRESVDDPLGLSFDVCDGRTLCVHAIRPGSSAARAYNASAPEARRLRPGDYVVEVNGTRGTSKAMMKEAEQGAEIHFVLRRPTTFLAELNKKGGSLGLGLNHSVRSMSIVVEAIQEGGPVVHWNRQHPEQEIRRGDRIIAVNGFKGSSRELLHGLSESGPLALLIARSSGAAPQAECGSRRSGTSSTTASVLSGESTGSGSSGSHRGLKTAR